MEIKQKGLTLVELMVTLAVAISMMAIAVPMYTSMVANNRAATQSNALVTALRLARSEAITRLAPVSVCARSTDTACGTDWTSGWIVFVDGGTTAGTLQAGEEIIRVFGSLESGASVDPQNSLTFIRYQATGGVDSAENLELQNDHTSGSQTRCIRIGATGQIIVNRNGC